MSSSVLVIIENNEFTEYGIDFVCRFGSLDDTYILFHSFEAIPEAQLLVPGERRVRWSAVEQCVRWLAVVVAAEARSLRLMLADIVVLKLGLSATVETINAVSECAFGVYVWRLLACGVRWLLCNIAYFWHTCSLTIVRSRSIAQNKVGEKKNHWISCCVPKRQYWRDHLSTKIKSSWKVCPITPAHLATWF
jgi:hypothetical protein